MRTLGAAEIALLAITCLLTACAGSGGGGGGGAPKPACKPPATTTVSFSANIQPIFNRSCALAGCHVGPVPTGPVDLSVGQAYGQTVNVKSAQQPTLKRFLPGKPDLSYIVRKIEGGPNISGIFMPQGCPGAPLNGARCLSADEIAAIRQWVTECALNN
ncbi:MAG: hypothetical protein E6J83_01100 [Deltaproteobacteria bacterium]|nr:MAG: hypothetical protein E6J83_01100 [Deltaproteobacteria bacterium]